MGEAESLWNACTDALRADVPDSIWSSCFQPSLGVELEDDRLVVAVPSVLVKERLESRWRDQVHGTLAAANGHPRVAVAFEVRTDAGPDRDAVFDQAPTELFPESPSFFPDSGRQEPLRPPRAMPAPSPDLDAPRLNSRYTFEAFVTGASNRFAHAAAQAVAETPARSYNPLFIYGVAGLGKTHLLHAIAHYVTQNYGHHQVRYVTTETFLNEYVDAIRTNTGVMFKRRYREVDVLLIDDIQFLENKEGLQEEFFHTFNSLHGANKQIVISSDRPPKTPSRPWRTASGAGSRWA